MKDLIQEAKKKPKVSLQVKLEAELLKAVKAKTKQDGIKLTELVKVFLKQYVGN
jgi:predicted DNA binding CopG/RHH family protein